MYELTITASAVKIKNACKGVKNEIEGKERKNDFKGGGREKEKMDHDQKSIYYLLNGDHFRDVKLHHVFNTTLQSYN